MNQLFYNIAGGIVHQIRRKKRTTISEVTVRSKRNIMQNRNWLYFNYSVESPSFIFQNFKVEKFKLTFKGWNRLVCHLCDFTSVFVKTCCISPLDSEANCDSADAESPCTLFFSFSASFKNLAQEKRSEISLRFVTSGLSLCLYSLLSQNIVFSRANNGLSCEKKIFGEAICSRHQQALSGFWARLRILNLIVWLC